MPRPNMAVANSRMAISSPRIIELSSQAAKKPQPNWKPSPKLKFFVCMGFSPSMAIGGLPG